MHFNLPDQLALEVASYDKTRKKLAATMAAEDRAKNKKKTYPNGKPSNLIPSDIVNDRTWSEIVEAINARPAKQKAELITKPIFGEEPKPIAIVYYYKQLWVAAWLPKRADDGYVYGVTVAYKDTAAARKQCTEAFFNNVTTLSECMFDQRGDESKMMPRIKDGRTQWYRKTVFFSKDDFNSGYTGNYWKSPDQINHHIVGYGATYEINQKIRRWEQELMKNVPTFSGGSDRTYFDRMNPENCKFEVIMKGYYSKPRWHSQGTDYVHDLDTIIDQLAKRFSHRCMKNIWAAKWFRSMVSKAMADTYSIHEEQTASMVYSRDALVKPYAILYQYIETIYAIKVIYEDMDLNLLHSRYDWLSRIDMPGYHSETGYEWIRNNVPVESFLNMLHMHYQKEVDSEYRSTDSKTGNKHVYMHLYRDTYGMLTQCLGAERIENLKPRRWRLQEWHDHLMAESWKINNPKVALPQKLFPEPIKVQIKEQVTLAEPNVLGTFTFFQPIDTHQLAAWGRAARNCVGGGYGYAEGVKKMKHLIILVMIDNKPRYTVQLTVDNGVMRVDQIADIGNRRLNDQERSTIEDAFKDALQQRESQLN